MLTRIRITLLTLPVAMLTGCGAGSLGPVKAPLAPAAAAALRGSVHGGQQPVAGATIQLYAAGTSGYGSAATPLISQTIVTNANGSFDVTGDYTCPSANAQTYLVASGGNSGSGTNPNLALMAALGPCSQLDALPSLNISEVTTVASVYVLAPFMTGLTNIGTSTSNTTGLANAMQDVNVLANLNTGNSGGSVVIAGATLPNATLNTLADILAACVNSNGGTAGDNSSCGKLFTATTSTVTPADTITAAMNIAQNPAANVAALYDLAPASAPFQPTLSKQPGDFTLAATFAGSVNGPSALATDAGGSVWITNAAGNTVTRLNHSGVPANGSPYSGQFTTPSAIAIAADGGAWITNQGSNSVSRLSSAGAFVANYTGGGLSQPRSIAFDSTGTAWIANQGSASVTTISGNGGTLSNYTPAAASGPLAIGVNPH